MKIKFLTAFGIAVFLCVNVYGQAPQKSAVAREADDLSAEVIKLYKEKKFNEAESAARRVINIREKELGKNHISLTDGWRNMAYIQLQLKNYKEAEKAFDRAFEIYESNQPLSPANEKFFVETIEASAFYDAADSYFDKAEKKFLRAVELREKINGRDSLPVAENLMKLGQIYRTQENYKKSAEVLLRALEIRKKDRTVPSEKLEEAFLETSCVYSKLSRSDELSAIKDEIYKNLPDTYGATGTIAPPNKINKGVVTGNAIFLAKPAYPVEARRNRASGAVNVQVLIDKEGNVLHACAVSGAKELQRASEIAAYASKFRPTILGGKPVSVMGVLVYNFAP